MPITINSEDVVWIGGDLYCKTPEALTIALEQIRGIGYEVKDERSDGRSIKEGRVTVEQMELNGWSLWYASLDTRRGKCDFCGSYITTADIRAHGTTCTECGEVIYRKLIDGSTVRFSFVDDGERSMFSPELNMEVKRWDTDGGWLYLKYGFLKGGLGVVIGDKAEAYLAANPDKWELVEEDGEHLIKVRYFNDFYVNPESTISMMDTMGHESHARIVKVWEAVEYSEYERLPIPDSFSIYETWHWAPLDASPILHKKVLGAVHNHDDKGWHYQDGRPWFRLETFAEMGKFVRHFTTLDADAWDEQSQRFRLDGPGGIDDVAAFCHPEAEVEDRPNIGNFLVGFSKAMSGQHLTPGEKTAMDRAVNEDPDTSDFMHSLVGDDSRRR